MTHYQTNTIAFNVAHYKHTIYATLIDLHFSIRHCIRNWPNLFNLAKFLPK